MEYTWEEIGVVCFFVVNVRFALLTVVIRYQHDKEGDVVNKVPDLLTMIRTMTFDSGL